MTSERLRILVIDDCIDTAQSLTFLLRDDGHLAEYALNGRTAIDAAKLQRPELIFLDIGLPDYDGVKLARDIKSTPGLEKIQIIALTGRISDDEQRALEAGCDLFLSKPIDPRTFVKVIKEVTERVAVR